MQNPIRIEIEKIYKSESGRVLASLIRILGDLDLAEEALQEAFLSRWKSGRKKVSRKIPIPGWFPWESLRPSTQSEGQGGAKN